MSSTLAMILAAGGVGALLTLALRGTFGGDGEPDTDGAGSEDSTASTESDSSDNGGDSGGGDSGGGGGDGGGD